MVHAQGTRLAAWAVLHSAVEAGDQQSQECAVQLLSDVLWQGRVDDVRSATGDLFSTPLRLPSKNALWQVSLLPGPNAASHLPKDHPLQGFFKVYFCSPACPSCCECTHKCVENQAHAAAKELPIYCMSLAAACACFPTRCRAH